MQNNWLNVEELKINVLSSPTGFPKSKTEYSSIKTRHLSK